MYDNNIIALREYNITPYNHDPHCTTDNYRRPFTFNYYNKEQASFIY